jgi:hypothetical protein
MKFCAHCGAELVKDAKFCVYCGNEIKILEEQPEKIFTTVVNEPEKEAVNEPINEAQNEAEKSAPESQQAYTEPPKSRPVYHAEPPKKEVSKSDAITSMVFGILSIFMAIFAVYPFVGFLFMGTSLAFIIVSKKKRNAYVREAGEDMGFSRAGKITSTVAIPLLCFFTLYGLVFTLTILLA